MNPIIKQLCDICVASLNKQQYISPLINEKALFVMSKENGLTGLIYPTIKKMLSVSEISRKVEKDYYTYIAADIKQNALAGRINALLNKHGIDHVFLKGFNLKTIYPESYMRGMGDIDILIRESDQAIVKNVFKDKKIILTGKAEHHDNYLYGKDVFIEVHHTLFPERHQFLDIDPWGLANSISQHCYEFEKEYELVYLLSHLAKHFASSGAGLRSVLDIGLYLKHYLNKLNLDKLFDYIKAINKEIFFTNIVYLNKLLFSFDFPENLYLSPLLLYDDYWEITQYIAMAGIHGYGHDFNIFAVQMATHQLKDKKPFSFYSNKIFPPYKTMKSIYPIIARWKILLPFGWVLRWFRLLFKKSTYNKIKKMKIKQKEVSDNINFLQKVGL
ncbi:MAG: nucleotidyltransferase family protein [Bacilli bacterium]|nr:nucleotidyltransferase family protein [Bacilli bacterium]MDD4077278.1 nucleotidyltransferase family protein [Bacilli bacterium]